LLSRYLKAKSIGSIAIPSSLFSGVAIPIVLFIQPHAYDVSLVLGAALIATGMSSVFAAVCYLYALDIDEASFVTHRFIRPRPYLLTSSVISSWVKRSRLFKDWVRSLLLSVRLHYRLSLVGGECGSSETLWH